MQFTDRAVGFHRADARPGLLRAVTQGGARYFDERWFTTQAALTLAPLWSAP